MGEKAECAVQGGADAIFLLVQETEIVFDQENHVWNLCFQSVEAEGPLFAMYTQWCFSSRVLYMRILGRILTLKVFDRQFFFNKTFVWCQIREHEWLNCWCDSPEYWVPSKEAIGTFFNVFGMTRLVIEPTTWQSQGGQSNTRLLSWIWNKNTFNYILHHCLMSKIVFSSKKEYNW